jgi:hypothetical protein
MDPTLNILGCLGPLPKNALFLDLDHVFASLQCYARANGYAIAKETTTDTRQVYRCSKGGKYNSKGKNHNINSSKRRKSSGSIKTGCPFRVVAHCISRGQWQVKVHNGNHNHSAESAVTKSTKHRGVALAPKVHSDIRIMIAIGSKPSLILQAVRLKHRGVDLVAKDIYNVLYSYRKKLLAGLKPTQWLFEVCALLFLLSWLTNCVGAEEDRKACPR